MQELCASKNYTMLLGPVLYDQKTKNCMENTSLFLFIYCSSKPTHSTVAMQCQEEMDYLLEGGQKGHRLFCSGPLSPIDSPVFDLEYI
jgi:hypothetical protein